MSKEIGATSSSIGKAFLKSYAAICLEGCILPRHSLVNDGIAWFQARGQWRDRSYVPESGTIIYFDWEPDGSPDHVGIVEYCDGSYVHTIEGNTRGDMCKQNVYTVGENDIYGYGVYAAS